jgi:D-alanyl-D-alanine carboxypeptidase
MRALASVVLSALAFSGLAIGQSRQPAETPLGGRLRAKFEELHKGGSFPGGTAGFALADGASFGIAVGVSDRTVQTPMKPADRLLLGSVGKTYASAVALQLVHEQRIALDDPISKHLGREPWFARIAHSDRMTVRQLMTHTSGLVRYELNPRFTADLSANPDKTWTPEERLSYLFDAQPPFAPGEGWEYSDTNYIVLGMIIEKVTGRAYHDLARERLFGPARLARTVPSDRRVIPGLANGYAGPDNPFGGSDAMLVDGRMTINPQFEWTGGGIASSAEDLARWGKYLYDGRALQPETMRQLLDGVPARLGQNTRYGLGVILRETPDGPVHGHSGFFPGYQAEVVYLPRQKVAVAFQVNSSVPGALGRGMSPARFALEVARIVAADVDGR